ncbi:SAM-dependent methyltransferase [Nocardia vinacea]|uniref:N-6 DNA methylase n=1 Tax=Nocardia vinacea TaxID=96468 RepID=UPI002E0F18E5|nr:SAM-dependent methyltransferase [Nocardia vinacea]
MDESIDGQLDSALAAAAGEREAGGGAWTTQDQIAHPSPQTWAALRALIDVVDAISGDLVRVFDLVLERYSWTQGVGGQYFTPRSIIRLTVGVADPRPDGTIFDPACGSGGFLLGCAQHLMATAPESNPPTLAGRELNPGILQIAHLNLLAHGLQADLGERPTNSLLDLNDSAAHDIVLLNPPFNQKNWATDREIESKVWVFGPPPRANANFAWLQRAVSLLSPAGRGVVLMPSESLRDSRSKPREVLQRLVTEDLVEAVVSLPDGLFPHVRVSACLWVLNKDKGATSTGNGRNRSGQTLFVDARDMGEQVTRGKWQLPDAVVDSVVRAIKAWRSSEWEMFRPEEVWPGRDWCGTADISEIKQRDWDLTPSRHISSTPHGEQGKEFDELVQRLALRMERVRDLDRILLQKLREQ